MPKKCKILNKGKKQKCDSSKAQSVKCINSYQYMMLAEDYILGIYIINIINQITLHQLLFQ